MYKTVRHGENSLQYKILAQQEEGLGGVKRRKSPRTVTAKLTTVIILLVIGIIASAVLVPLVLTNDFIALTGTFQKFSVSTLRRSHSGNHVVVIAKKPHGWSSPHSSVSTRLPSASQTQKSTSGTDSPSLTSVSTSTIQTVKTTTENPQSEITSDLRGRNEKTENPPTKATVENNGKVPGSVEVDMHQQESFQRKITEGVRISTTLEPIWFENLEEHSKLHFGSSNNFINGANGAKINYRSQLQGTGATVNREVIHLFSILGSFFLIVFIIIFVIVRKMKKRTLTERETAESKEGKTRLLKPSGSSDHDEE